MEAPPKLIAHYWPVLQTSPSANSTTTPADLSLHRKQNNLLVGPNGQGEMYSYCCAALGIVVVVCHLSSLCRVPTHRDLGPSLLSVVTTSAATSVIAGAKYNQSMLHGDCALHEQGIWFNCRSRETLSYFRTFFGAVTLTVGAPTGWSGPYFTSREIVINWPWHVHYTVRCVRNISLRDLVKGNWCFTTFWAAASSVQSLEVACFKSMLIWMEWLIQCSLSVIKYVLSFSD